MSRLEKEYITKIENTSNYGLLKEGAQLYDEQRILNEYLLNFKIYKIRCISVKHVGIAGIRILHKDRITYQDVKTIDISVNELNGEEEEITLEQNEIINEVIIWKDEALRGFEIKTNRGRTKTFGWCGEGTKVELDELDNGKNYLVGFFFGFHKKDGIQSMGIYHNR